MKKKNFVSFIGKQLTALLLCAALLAGPLAASAGAAQEAVRVTAQLCPHFTIVVDGKTESFYNAQGQEVYPLVYQDTTYLPLRAIGELMNKNVNWDQSNFTITLSGTRSAQKVTGTPDKSAKQKAITAQIRPDFTIIVDGVKCSFTDANGKAISPLLYDGITYLPLRAIGQLMGSTVAWDASTNTVILTAKMTTNSGSLVTDADSFSQNVQKDTSSQSSQNGIDGTMLSADAAKTRALAHAGLDASQVTIVKQKLEREDGSQIYKIEFYTSNKQTYEYEIDAYTGAIISFDYAAKNKKTTASITDQNGYIGKDEVQSIALAKVPGAANKHITKLKLKLEDGSYVYDVEIVYDNMEYEFEIDAYSGAILSWEFETIHN